jgi:hypothetical protein
VEVPASNAMRGLLMYSVLARGVYWRCLQVAFVFATAQSIPCLGLGEITSGCSLPTWDFMSTLTSVLARGLKSRREE